MGPESNSGDVSIHTGLHEPVGIGLAQSLLDEAEIPYFVKNQTTGARRDLEALEYWTILVPAEREAEAREILRSIEAEA